MIDLIKSLGIEQLLSIVSMLVVLPIWGIFKNFLTVDSLDEVMLSRPKQRIKNISKIVYIILYMLFLYVYFIFFVVPELKIENIIDKSTMIFMLAFGIYIQQSNIVDIYDVELGDRGTLKNRFYLNLLISIIGYGIIGYALMMYIGNYKDFKYIIQMELIFIVVSFVNIYIVKKVFKSQIKKIIYNRFFIMILTLNYIIITLSGYIILTEKIVSVNLFIIFTISYIISFIKLDKRYKKVQYFECSYDVAKLYDINFREILELERFYNEELGNMQNLSTKLFERFKLYIYYTTNDTYYVCGTDKICTSGTKRYIINYDDVHKCGGFMSEYIYED